MQVRWQNLFIALLCLVIFGLLLCGGPRLDDPLLPVRELLNSPSSEDRTFGLALLCVLLITLVALIKLLTARGGGGGPYSE